MRENAKARQHTTVCTHDVCYDTYTRGKGSSSSRNGTAVSSACLTAPYVYTYDIIHCDVGFYILRAHASAPVAGLTYYCCIYRQVRAHKQGNVLRDAPPVTDWTAVHFVTLLLFGEATDKLVQILGRTK